MEDGSRPAGVPSPEQPAASSSGRADRQLGAPSRSYDYQKAFNSLQARVRELSAAKEAQGGQASRVRSMLNILRTNTANMLALLTIYSITTAAVVGAAFAERQRAADAKMCEAQHEQLQRQREALEHSIAQRRSTLRELQAEMERSAGAWRLGPAQQRMLALLDRGAAQQQQQQPPQAEAGLAPAGAAGQPVLSEDEIEAMLEEQRRRGLRPGQQLGGRGFMI